MLKDKKVDFAALWCAGSFFCCSAEHDSFFCIGCLQLLGPPVTAVMFRRAVKEINCNMNHPLGLSAVEN